MGYRSTYNRRLRAASRLKKRLAVAALLGVGVCAAAFLLQGGPVSERSDQVAETAPAQAAIRPVAATVSLPAAHAGARRIYPYSVVPGGVSGRAELAHVLQTDQVVAQHYAGLQVASTRVVTVSKPRAVYVSYRKGDQVYWTSKKMVLAQGETLLSDGSSEIRTRCGNRISDVPRLPVEAAGPSAQVLDTAMDVDPDQADAGMQQVSTALPANGVPAVQSAYQAASAQGAAQVPSASRTTAALAMLGMSGIAGGSAPAIASDRLGMGWTTVSSRGVMTNDSNAAPGSSGDSAGTTTGTSSGSSSDGTGSSASTGGTGGSSGTPSTSTPVLGDEGGSSGTTTKPDLPPLSNSLPPTGPQPGDINKTPPKPNKVPEPGSLWLCGAALAAMLMLRRKARRSGRG